MIEENRAKKIYIILTILAGLASYAAYFLKISNTYNLVIGIIFFIFTLKYFKTIKGMLVLFCLILFNLFTIPLAVYLMGTQIGYKIFILIVNLALMGFVLVGLERMKKWGFYLAIVVLAISAINIGMFLLAYMQGFIANTQQILVASSNFISLLLSIIFIVYLVKNKKAFS